MQRFIICDQSAIERGGHYLEYTLCVAHAAARRGFVPHVLCNRRLKIDGAEFDGIEFHPVFTRTWGQAEAEGLPPTGSGNIVFETEVALTHLGATSGDHVLLHTLGLAELHAWLEHLVKLPRYRFKALPTFHLLMRFDPEPLLRVASPSWRGLQQRLAKRKNILKGFVHLCADTHLLAEQYMRILGMEISVAPIPFDQAPLKAAVVATKTPAKHTKAITALYLGDARLEKGFEHFPEIVRKLWEIHLKPRKLRFVFQANTNIPGGEGNIAQVIRTLGQYPAAVVEIIHEPMPPSDYFHRLVECDIVLIAYDPQRYRWRSSGILVEALAAGKPVITTAGSWMATQVSPDHAELIENHEEIPNALARLVARFSAARKAAQKLSHRWLDYASPDNYLDHLLAHTPTDAYAKATVGRPTILFVMDGNAMVLRNGASRVAHRQLSYLFSRNYRVVGIFIAPHFARQPAESMAWSQKLGQELRDYPFDAVHALMVNPATEALNIPVALFAWMKNQRPSAVLLNYVTYLPALEALGLENIPIICEIHSTQSFQKAIYGNRFVPQSDADNELALLAKCSHLISLNEIEAAWVKEHLPQLHCATVPMAFEAQSGGERLLYGYRDLAELVAACGPEDAALNVVQDDFPEPSTAQEKLIRFGGRLDLLYIGSAHQRNVSGLKWFIEEAFIPLLAPKGLNMVVAGTIKHACVWPEHPNLVFTGKLDNIAPLYAAAKLVVLPVIEGDSSRIKVYEAIAHGKPVVGTPLAFDRLAAEPKKCVTTAERASCLATDIQKLIDNPALRQEQARASHNAVDNTGRENCYQHIMDGILFDAAKLAVRDAQCIVESQAVEVAAETYAFKEWSSEIQTINRIVASWLNPERLFSENRQTTILCGERTFKKLEPKLQKAIRESLNHALSTHVNAYTKNRLLDDLHAAANKALVLAGVYSIRTKRTKSSISTKIVVGTTATNILSIKLIDEIPSFKPCALTVCADQKVLAPILIKQDGQAARADYELAVDKQFQCLQVINIDISIPQPSSWRIESIILEEFFPIDVVCRHQKSSRSFHSIECPAEFSPFAWTKRPTVRWLLPIWRGIDKNLQIRVHSFRKNITSGISLKIDGEATRSVRVERGDGDGGTIHCKMPWGRQADVSQVIQIETRNFDRASRSDPRLIGIAVQQVSVTSQVL